MHPSILRSSATIPAKRSRLRSGFLLAPLTLIFLVLAPASWAVVPAPDGGYPGGNTAEGRQALLSLTTGTSNTAIGFHALFSITTASSNTAVGSAALASNTSGILNTATGASALGNNSTGGGNTANGASALQGNTIGGSNTATGFNALAINTTGSNNTATGFQALLNNTTGTINTATGFQALLNNTTGSDNTANGVSALQANTTGAANTVIGGSALLNNTTGSNNTATGEDALQNNTTGLENTACGEDALINNTTGSDNIGLGVAAGSNLTTGNNNIDIGNAGVAAESGTIRIGTAGTHTATFVSGISGVVLPAGVGVRVDATGQLGTIVSSQRFKEAIQPMAKVSEAIYSLRPVSFRYKHELDPARIPQFGLVAEEVERVSPDLVARDKAGTPYTVRYEEVNVMLLNEFLKEHRKVEEHESTIATLRSADARQEARIADQQKEIKILAATVQEQAAQIRKVSNLIKMSKATQLTADTQ